MEKVQRVKTKELRHAIFALSDPAVQPTDEWDAVKQRLEGQSAFVALQSRPDLQESAFRQAVDQLTMVKRAQWHSALATSMRIMGLKLTLFFNILGHHVIFAMFSSALHSSVSLSLPLHSSILSLNGTRGRIKSKISFLFMLPQKDGAHA